MADGALIIIGGHEDKMGERLILKEVARRLKGGRLVVCTVASHEPDGYFDAYRKAFRGLGVDIWSRSTSTSAPKAGTPTSFPPSRTPRESSSPAATSSAYPARLETLRSNGASGVCMRGAA